MRILPYIDQPDDEPFWIKREAFLAHFDQNDFVGMREVKDVTAAYRQDWFPLIDGIPRFQIAVVTFIGNKTQFINGRHRTAVLSTYLNEIPIALATRLLNPAQLALREAIPKRKMKPEETIELPNLPFLNEQRT